MKPLKTLITQSLVISSLMLPWTTTAAADLTTKGLVNDSDTRAATKSVKTFDRAGVITKLRHDRFTVSGETFRISPRALLNSDDSSRQRFSDFKKGDHIYFKGKILNGIQYVDIVFYETPDTT